VNLASSRPDATSTDDVVQVTDDVRSCVVLSEKMPVAVNCLLVFSASVGSVGVIEMDMSCASELLVEASKLAVPAPPPPHPTRPIIRDDIRSMKHDFLFTMLCSSSALCKKHEQE